MNWYLALLSGTLRRPRPLVVPECPPAPEAIDPVEVPIPRERDDGLPHMSIDAP